MICSYTTLALTHDLLLLVVVAVVAVVAVAEAVADADEAVVDEYTVVPHTDVQSVEVATEVVDLGLGLSSEVINPD